MTAHSIVPGDRLFWSVIEVSGARAGPLPAGLWPLLEDDLPMAAAELWAVAAPIDQARTAVCAVRKVDLIDLAPGAVTLTPANVPDFIEAPAAAFNFLIGEHEPFATRRARLRRHVAAAACTLLAVSLAAVGLWRRTDTWKAEARAAQVGAIETIASVAPRSGWSRDELALELMQRRQATPSDLTPPADAAQALAGVIAGWPTQVASKPQSISASGTSASISVIIPGDSQAFLAAMRAPEGWTLDEPRLAAIDKATRLSLELRRESPR